uniref:Putative tail protein n=1 Tax=viral metagenome TaxID=1070528 RepID=A0A6H1ZQI4_9ZZZZ
MGIEAIGDGIKTRLDTIAGLRVYAPKQLEDKLELPCALVLLGPSSYATTYDPDYDCVFRIVVCLAKQDTPSAFNNMLDYIEPAGAKSIFAAVNGDNTLNGSCSASKLARNLGIGNTVWGGIVYLSTEFELQVWS